MTDGPDHNLDEESYLRSVFINCPFDRSHVALLRPLLFTVVYVGFRPRIALEAFDSGRESSGQDLSPGSALPLQR